MPYRVVFKKNGRPREILVEATKIQTDSGYVTFLDDDGHQVAVIPKDRIFYIKKKD